MQHFNTSHYTSGKIKTEEYTDKFGCIKLQMIHICSNYYQKQNKHVKM